MDYCYVVEFTDYDAGGVHYAGRDIHKALQVMNDSQAALSKGSTGGYDTLLFIDGVFARSVYSLKDAYEGKE